MELLITSQLNPFSVMTNNVIRISEITNATSSYIECITGSRLRADSWWEIDVSKFADMSFGVFTKKVYYV